MQRHFTSLLVLVVALLLTACSEESAEQPTASAQPAPATDQGTATTAAATTPESESESESELPPIEPGQDYHSFANVDQIRTRHLDLVLDVDFDRQVIDGEVTHHLERPDPTATTLVLDTRDLTIESVVAAPSGETLRWKLGETDAALGTPLRIEVPVGVEQVTIGYQTSPQASGLQWLDPVQTTGEHPFLFTQAQAIHARSFVPLQDTPGIRITFDAVMRTPPELRAVMGAVNDAQAPTDGEYTFEMPQPIPSYLLAFAVGDLAFRPMSERTGVYAEPAIVDAAAAEFADTEQMMQVAETLFGPYRWGRYDLLILPPSFPFGGMENPRLSFITPTVIAGDKSLVALIAHELAHSWSGNLVTNASWRDLWLNEGFTTYLESRIMEAVFGEDRRRMEDVLGYQSLVDDLKDLDPPDQRLTPDLRGRDPDDVFSNVPYEKGRLLLVYLESQFNRQTFDLFLRRYFDHFAFKSLTTEEFLTYLDANLLSKYPGKVALADVKRWLEQPGIPDMAVLPTSDAFTQVDQVRQAWLDGEIEAAALPVTDWTVHHWLYFLNNMPESLTPEQMAQLDASHELTTSGNNEIVHSWLRLAIEHRYQPAMERLEQYLVGIGRRKLIVPLYEDLMATDWGAPMARRIYERARPGYHPLAQGTLDDVVK